MVPQGERRTHGDVNHQIYSLPLPCTSLPGLHNITPGNADSDDVCLLSSIVTAEFAYRNGSLEPSIDFSDVDSRTIKESARNGFLFRIRYRLEGFIRIDIATYWFNPYDPLRLLCKEGHSFV